MAHKALVVIGGCLVLCVGCAALAVVLWRNAETSVSNEIASVIATQVVDNIGTSRKVVLSEEDLDINTYITLDGSCGFNVTNGNAEIYGMKTEISKTKITFGCAEVEYSAVPVVQDGRIVVANIDASNGVMNMVFPKGKLKGALERGLNDAMAARSVKPVGITLRDGSMTILVEGA
jgi:hypothetical protein